MIIIQHQKIILFRFMSFCLHRNSEQTNQTDYFMKQLKNCGLEAIIIQENCSEDEDLTQNLISSKMNLRQSLEEENLDFSQIRFRQNQKHDHQGENKLGLLQKKISGLLEFQKKKFREIVQGLNSEIQCLKNCNKGIKDELRTQIKQMKHLNNKIAEQFNKKIVFILQKNQKMCKQKHVKLINELIKKNQLLIKNNMHLTNELEKQKRMKIQTQNSDESCKQTSVNIKLRYLNTIQKFSKQIKNLQEQIQFLKLSDRKKQQQCEQKNRQLQNIEEFISEKQQQFRDRQAQIQHKQRQIAHHLQFINHKYEQLKSIEIQLVKNEQQTKTKYNNFPYHLNHHNFSYQQSPQSARKMTKTSAIQTKIMDQYQVNDVNRRLSLNNPIGQFYQVPVKGEKRYQRKSFNFQKQKKVCKTLSSYEVQRAQKPAKKLLDMVSIDNKINLIQKNLYKQLSSLNRKKRG